MVGKKNAVFYQRSKVNRGLLRDYEEQIAKGVFDNGPVDIELVLKYGAGGTRPTKMRYSVFRGGELIDGRVFSN